MKAGFMVNIVLFVSIYSPLGKGAYLYEHIGALLNDLKTGYNKDVLPVQNKSSVLNVELFLSVYSVTDIDSVKGALTLQVTGSCRWKDPRMTWKPEVYGNVSSVWIPKDNVWKPTLAVSSSVDYSTLGGPEAKVKYDFNGLATWQAGKMITISCRFYMKYWPFDKQVCRIVISVMDYSSTQVPIMSIEPGIDTDLVHMMEWTMEETDVDNGIYDDTSFLVYTIKLKRKYIFYLFTTILPITFIAFLQPFVFLLPSEAGERVGFSITIVLSMTVYFTIISDQIPRTAEPMALICGYIMFHTVSSVAMTILVILNLRLRQTPSTKPVGQWFRKVHELALGNSGTRETEVLREIKPDTGMSEKRVEVQYLPPPDEHDNGQYLNESENVENDNDLEPITKEPTLTWCDVSQATDKILFIFSVLITVLPSVVFLFHLQMASVYNPDTIEY